MMFIVKAENNIYTQVKAIFIGRCKTINGELYCIKVDISDEDGFNPIVFRCDNFIQVRNVFDGIFRSIRIQRNLSTVIIDFDKIQHQSDDFYYGKGNDDDKKTAKETSSKQPD